MKKTKKKSFVDLLPSDIVLDDDFNCRKEKPRSTDAEEPDEQLSDAQFEQTIQERGVLEAPRVRFVRITEEQHAWICVYGYRRVRAACRVRPGEKIRCTIMPSSGNEEADDLRARFENLTENLHRQSLKPWEIAEALYQITARYSELTDKQVCEQAGVTYAYGNNLLRLRRKAHPVIWEQFKRWGTSMRIGYSEVLRIVTFPAERQLEEWNKILETKKSMVGKRGKEKRPGPFKLQRMLKSVRLIRKDRHFKRGLELGLAIALGHKEWPFGFEQEER